MMRVTTRFISQKHSGTDVFWRAKEGWFAAKDKEIAKKMDDAYVYGLKADIEWEYRGHKHIVMSITLHDEKMIDNNSVGGTMTPNWTGD
jgi:hypothetical protein